MSRGLENVSIAMRLAISTRNCRVAQVAQHARRTRSATWEFSAPRTKVPAFARKVYPALWLDSFDSSCRLLHGHFASIASACFYEAIVSFVAVQITTPPAPNLERSTHRICNSKILPRALILLFLPVVCDVSPTEVFHAVV
jgi:hypothetical protein